MKNKLSYVVSSDTQWLKTCDNVCVTISYGWYVWHKWQQCNSRQETHGRENSIFGSRSRPFRRSKRFPGFMKDILRAARTTIPASPTLPLTYGRLRWVFCASTGFWRSFLWTFRAIFSPLSLEMLFKCTRLRSPCKNSGGESQKWFRVPRLRVKRTHSWPISTVPEW